MGLGICHFAGHSLIVPFKPSLALREGRISVDYTSHRRLYQPQYQEWGAVRTPAMQYQQHSSSPGMGLSVPLYAPTPLQPVHPTPFYIDDILGRSAASNGTPAMSTPTLPSPNSSFTSLVTTYRTPVYEPTPIHPAFTHPAALAATYGTSTFQNSLYSFSRPMSEYTHALIRHDSMGK